MLKLGQWIGMLAGLGLVLGAVLPPAAAAIAIPEITMELPHGSTSTQEFKRIEQPLEVKLGVTAVGVGLIGLELWWFLLSKSRSKARSNTTPVNQNQL
jgi:plastocyanin domain-containing protein